MALHPRRKHGRHIPLQVRNRTGGGDVETHHEHIAEALVQSIYRMIESSQPPGTAAPVIRRAVVVFSPTPPAAAASQTEKEESSSIYEKDYSSSHGRFGRLRKPIGRKCHILPPAPVCNRAESGTVSMRRYQLAILKSRERDLLKELEEVREEIDRLIANTSTLIANTRA